MISLLPSTGTCALDTNLYDPQASWVLVVQQKTGQHYPICYWSRFLTEAKPAYYTTSKECLALFWAVSILCPYLGGPQIHLRVDHKVLHRIRSLFFPTGKLVRWRMCPFEFNFDMRRWAGVEHQVAYKCFWLSPNGKDRNQFERRPTCTFSRAWIEGRGEGNEERNHVVSEMVNAITPRLPAVFSTATRCV